jgi:hypothetical protein
VRREKLGFQGRAAVAAIALFTAARHGGDNAAGIDAPYPAAGAVGYIKLTVGTYG